MSNATISASKLRNNLSEALDSVDEDNVLIVTRRGKKDRAIIDIDKLEDLLDENDTEYLESIRKARASKEYLTHDEVFGDL
ncbi:MAG: type II toxin-antitoxin system Phd/YefM family antitoxin [Candidatus Saccharibacteria bacterium]